MHTWTTSAWTTSTAFPVVFVLVCVGSWNGSKQHVVELAVAIESESSVEKDTNIGR
jgi:hypothetical protein